jgi:hypothetical protein
VFSSLSLQRLELKDVMGYKLAVRMPSMVRSHFLPFVISTMGFLFKARVVLSSLG